MRRTCKPTPLPGIATLISLLILKGVSSTKLNASDNASLKCKRGPSAFVAIVAISLNADDTRLMVPSMAISDAIAIRTICTTISATTVTTTTTTTGTTTTATTATTTTMC